MTTRIVIYPNVSCGRLIVSGTRMRVSDVLDALASSVAIEELLADFPYLTREDVHACWPMARAPSIIRSCKPPDPLWTDQGVRAPDMEKPTAPCYHRPMTKLTPIESEFATTQEAEAYDAWFRAKVEASLADTTPPIPHDQVMAELRAIIEAKTASQA